MSSQREDGRDRLDQTPRQALLAGWATPVATEIGNTEENYLAMKANMKSGARTAITHPSIQALLAGWQSPTAGDHNRGDYQRDRGEKGKERLSNRGAGKAAAIEGRFAIRCQVRQEASGLALTGCSVETLTDPNCGQLDPAHSAWLQGIPADLQSCVATAMRSISKLRRNSSSRSGQS